VTDWVAFATAMRDNAAGEWPIADEVYAAARAEGLLAEGDPNIQTLVVVGGAHVPHFLRAVPGLPAAFVHFRSGQPRHHGFHDVVDREPPAGVLVVEVENGRPSTCA
jgi:hypothetical protein